ncbi:MAG: CinA family protein, partial [Propionibacteriaceae bacterium]|nr:CinA family protein [Propionibacteriaceae bacterium]
GLKSTRARVDAKRIAENGVRNPSTAAQMARGWRKVWDAGVGLACSGVAGPDPQDGEQAGTVFIAVVYRGAPVVKRLQLEGSREEIRCGTVERLLDLGCEVVRGSEG